DCHCAYCIIPTVRGGARSRPARAVLAEVRRCVGQGQPETEMTGISVGAYRDPERGLDLGEPMLEVVQVRGVDRARRSSVELIDAAEITRVHAFSYSPRPGTAADALGDQVPAEEKKLRSRELRGHAEVRSRHHRAARLGGVEQVLVDKVADTQCSGYTADYTRCYLPPAAA